MRRRGIPAQEIAPCLWFDGKAEEAVSFYTSIFKNSKVGAATRYGEAGPGENGSVKLDIKLLKQAYEQG